MHSVHPDHSQLYHVRRGQPSDGLWDLLHRLLYLHHRLKMHQLCIYSSQLRNLHKLTCMYCLQYWFFPQLNYLHRLFE